MESDDLDRVVPMDEMDGFRVAEGDPDVRGWEVVGSDGRTLGKVHQLLVDRSAMKVRYLDVGVAGDLADDDRHVLLPIGYARLDRDGKRVHADTLSSAELRDMPAYRRGGVTRDFESAVLDHLDRGRTASGSAGGTAGADFYVGGAYDENRFYGRSGQSHRRSIEGEL